MMMCFRAITASINVGNLWGALSIPERLEAAYEIDFLLQLTLIGGKQEWIDIRKRLIGVGEKYYTNQHTFTDENMATVIACLHALFLEKLSSKA